MARRKGVLSPKRWAKGINVAQTASVLLSVQLARHGQVGWAIEEIFGVIDLLNFNNLSLYLLFGRNRWYVLQERSGSSFLQNN